MKATNMTSNNGNKVPNQFIIQTPSARYFKSYDSIIVKTTFIEGKRTVFLDEKYWNFSKTTSKYRSEFLGENKAETQKKINSGEYILTDLQQDI